jgi:hypothetical protein
MTALFSVLSVISVVEFFWTSNLIFTIATIALASSLSLQTTPAPDSSGGGRHRLVIHTAPKDFEGGQLVLASVDSKGVLLSPKKDRMAVFTSREIVAPMPFNEMLPSWNVVTPKGSGFSVEIQMRGRNEKSYSPWLAVGEWGAPPPLPVRKVRYERGRIAVDYFTSKNLFESMRYRLTARGPEPLRVKRVALCFSDRASRTIPRSGRKTSDSLWKRRLTVPFCSQGWVPDKKIRGEICSPASVVMVMGYLGVERRLVAMARSIYDSRHRIYGNWTRAIQGAFAEGVPGHIQRFGEWGEVEAMVAAGQPLVISIAFKKGELAGAPFPQSTGHLLVICGFDEDGNVEVNDPAARQASRGQTVYRRDQLQKAWLDRGGTAYVFLKP